MNDNLRYLLAGTLIFIVILLQPTYLRWLGYGEDSSQQNSSSDYIPQSSAVEEKVSPSVSKIGKGDYLIDAASPSPEKFITIASPLYTATISNRAGGSIHSYILTEFVKDNYKYIGGYNKDGVFNDNLMVSLIMPSENYCSPCLAVFDDIADQYKFINSSFTLISPSNVSDTLFITGGESVEFQYVLNDSNGHELIKKHVLFSANSYVSEHVFEVNENMLDSEGPVELMWAGGVRPTELKQDEDIQYSSGVVGQAGETEDVQTTSPDKNISRTIYNGTTDWVAVRSKYFISALISNTPGSFATLSAENVSFGSRKHTPAYNASVGFPLDVSAISSSLYLGPLDIDHISKTNTNLDATMNWGWAIIRPISKGILWVLKFMHNALHLNYGLVLLLFALLVRFVTGPLTKKSFESTQKMQKIQPQIKKVQEKYKKDPQRLNREMMAMYKTHGVNPLGGCLPMLLQMPLLMALFVVFRSTIEFRGQPFIFWINDLSKPDIVFSLPFSIPVYGDGVAILPLLMGVTLFLTMRMSSATMDKNQKPVMYFMNGFFILLFNSFPSGLNLYYTAYNLMSFLQQRGIRKNLAT